MFGKVRRLEGTEDGNFLPLNQENEEDSGGHFLGCERLERADIFTSLSHVED